MKKSLATKLLVAAVLVPLIAVGILIMMNLFSKAPENLGIHNGKLADCPKSPNCVCTQATSESHQRAAILCPGDAATTMKRVKSTIGSMPRTRIVEESENYLRVEFTTAIMRYVDDVEFLIDDSAGVVHFRSASRVGYSDMGANRKRMTAFKEALAASASND